MKAHFVITLSSNHCERIGSTAYVSELCDRVSFQYKVFGVVQLFPVDKPQPAVITFPNHFFDRHAMLVAFCSV